MTLRWPGIEPGSTAWKAAMLTIIPPTLFNMKQIPRFRFGKIKESNKKWIQPNILEIMDR